MSDRLKRARESAGYSTAKEAAEAMGLSVPTYIQHENGTRNFPRDPAERYARFFRSTPEWLLYGRGPQVNEEQPSVEELEEMLRSVMNEAVTVQTKISDLPRICAASLFEQLMRFSIDRSLPNHRDIPQQFPSNEESHPSTN